MALVLVGVSVPSVLNSALTLIGQATSGVALFVAGVTIAAHKIIVNLEVGVNIVLKMLAQPALFLLLALALSIKHCEGFLLTALPSDPIGVLLATRYQTYQSEASSTLALTTLALLMTFLRPGQEWEMVGLGARPAQITLPLTFFLIGGA